MLCEQHIWKAKHFLDIFLTDSSQKVLVLPLRRHAGAANNARTSHFSRIIASVAWTDFQRQPRADDWPATRSRRMNRPVSSVQYHEFGALACWACSRWAACSRWVTKNTEKFPFFIESLRPVYGVQTVFFLLLPWLFKLREISWWKVVVTALTSWVVSPSGKTLRKVLFGAS